MSPKKVRKKKVKKKTKTGKPAVVIRVIKGTKTRPSSYDVKVGSLQQKIKVSIPVVGQTWGVKDVGYPEYRFGMGNALFTFYLPDTRLTTVRDYVMRADKEIHKKLGLEPDLTLYAPRPEGETSQPLDEFLFDSIRELLKSRKKKSRT